MSGSTENPVTADAANEAVTAPWHVEGDALHAAYKTGSMVRGGEFVARIIDAAEAAGHHPDIDLRYPSVSLKVTTHSAGRLTEADVALANRIAEIAQGMDLGPAD